MAGFLLGLVIGVLINLVTALFNRDKALKLIPWIVFYLLIHATYVVLDTSPILEIVMTSARRFHSLFSYFVVMVIGACLAALYWYAASGAGHALDKATTHSVPSVPQHHTTSASPSGKLPTADEIAESIAKHSGPSAVDKARRYFLRKDLIQYLMRGSLERDTFRILLQPTVNENGKPIDQTEKIGKAMLRIQEWNSELTFYVQSRLGEDSALWLMNKTPSERYPSNIGDLPGLSQSWDTVASSVSKIEQLLKEFPEIPGGAEAAAAIEVQSEPAIGLVDWREEPINAGGAGQLFRVKVTFRAKRDLENPILDVQFNSAISGLPEVHYPDTPVLLGNKRLKYSDTYHCEVLHKWTTGKSFFLLVASKQPIKVKQVLLRLW